MKIADIIKYEGDNDVLVWKHPSEDFNTMTQLIVHSSQEAMFFRDGRALDVFGPGRYTLHTQNLPYLSKLINIPTDGKSPFHCEVYFVNKTIPLDIKWGTSSQVVVQDPKFNILIHAGVNGGMGIQIENSRMFLEKIVGTMNPFSKESFITYFREMIATRVKTYLTKIMSSVSFVTVNTRLDDMSKAMFDMLSTELAEFGVKLVKFFVSSIKLDKDDYERIQSALADAGAVGIAATAEKGKMETLGYNWADQEMAQILKIYAGNEGNQNNAGGMMAQMPLAFAFGEMMKDSATPLMRSAFSAKSSASDIVHSDDGNFIFCSNCGKKLESDANFCSKCGKSVKSSEYFCKNCGRKLNKDDIFCPICGIKKEV